MNSYRLRTFEAIFIILTVFLINIFLQVPSLLITNTGSSTLLNIIYISIITLIYFFIVYFLFSKFPGLDIIDISEYLGGKFFKLIVGFLYIAFIIISTSIMIRIFAEGTVLIYFSHLNINTVILVFVLAAGILNFLGFKSINRLNMIILPITMFSIIFLYFSSLNNYTIQRIYPILGYGLSNTFIKGLTNIFAYGGFFILFFIFPFLNKANEFKKVGIFTLIIYTVFLLLAVSSLLFSFSQMSDTNSFLSLYLLARQISLGEYIQNIDAIFLLIWIPFLLSYLSIKLHFALSTFQKLTNIQETSGMVYSFCAIIFFISLLPQNIGEITFLGDSIYKYLIIGFVFIFSFIILLFAFIKKIFSIIFKKGENLTDV